MGLKDFVEPGRVCFINFGEDYGKMCVIVDILDSTRVYVDHPEKKFPRVIYPLKRLTLTNIRLNIQRGCRNGTLAKAAKAAGLAEQWAKNSANQKMQNYARRNALSDLERFKVMVARRQRSFAMKHGAGGKKKPAAKPAAAAKGKAKK